jgi:hypothetical protein
MATYIIAGRPNSELTSQVFYDYIKDIREKIIYLLKSLLKSNFFT